MKINIKGNSWKVVWGNINLYFYKEGRIFSVLDEDTERVEMEGLKMQVDQVRG